MHTGSRAVTAAPARDQHSAAEKGLMHAPMELATCTMPSAYQSAHTMKEACWGTGWPTKFVQDSLEHHVAYVHNGRWQRLWRSVNLRSLCQRDAL